VRTELDWLEISVTTDNEAAEAVVELFNRYGRGRAVVETPVDCFEYELTGAPPSSRVVVKTYLPLDGSADSAQRRLEEGLWHLSQIYPIPEPDIRELAEEDWTEAWKQQYHRLRVGQRIVIVPAWEAYEPAADEITIQLEPGMAFGTGLHPTTRLCLEMMEKYLKPDRTVLDVGTGSGVLAIAAAKLGASSVLALDADPMAVTVAQENVEMNGVAGQVTVRHGSLPGGDAVPRHFATDGSLALLDTGKFDLVIINILAPVIVGMAPALAARLQSEGQLIAAGLIDSQEREVVDVLKKQRLQVVDRTQEKDWVSLVVQRR
jgi:ribosomal protein L11 methyltransferase